MITRTVLVIIAHFQALIVENFVILVQILIADNFGFSTGIMKVTLTWNSNQVSPAQVSIALPTLPPELWMSMVLARKQQKQAFLGGWGTIICNILYEKVMFHDFLYEKITLCNILYTTGNNLCHLCPKKSLFITKL